MRTSKNIITLQVKMFDFIIRFFPLKNFNIDLKKYNVNDRVKKKIYIYECVLSYLYIFISKHKLTSKFDYRHLECIDII